MLNEDDYEEIRRVISSIFVLPDRIPLIEELVPYLTQDKKNEDGVMKFSLLQKIGECSYDIDVSESEIRIAIESFNY